MTASVPVNETISLVLVMVRVAFLFLLAPIFGHPSVPIRVRMGLAFAVSLALLPSASEGAALDGSLVSACLHEAMVGAMLGFSAAMVFAGLALAGEFASIQGGLGAATVLDPSSGASSIVLTSLVQLFALFIFLAVGGHHMLLQSLALSYVQLPLGGAGIEAALVGELVAMGGLIFEVAVRFAAPVTGAMVLANLAVGVLGRAIPQLNLMALQLPAHVAVTLLLIGLGAGPFADELQRLYVSASNDVALRLLGAG